MLDVLFVVLRFRDFVLVVAALLVLAFVFLNLNDSIGSVATVVVVTAVASVPFVVRYSRRRDRH